jgi:poly(A) polymerase
VVAPATLRQAWDASALRRQVTEAVREQGLEAYAVGGAVRDVLLGRTPQDWDVLTEDPAWLGLAVARTLGATAVTLHDEPVTLRLVLIGPQAQGGREELDICGFRGPDLAADLQLRDFTINSLAWSPADDAPPLDPVGGLRDLAARRVRAHDRCVLAADPLRCLRAYRIAAELGFTVDRQTERWIRQEAPGLARVAGERVGAEVVKLAAAPGFADSLRRLDSVGILAQVLPEMLPMKGMRQGRYHHLDVWRHTLLVIELCEAIAADPTPWMPRSAEAIGEYVSGPEGTARLKLAALLHDVGKPPTRALIGGRVRFLQHSEVGAAMVSKLARRLRLSRALKDALRHLVSEHMRPILLLDNTEAEPSRAAVGRLMRDCAPDGVAEVVLAAADLLACQGPATDADDQRMHLELLDRMLATHFEWEHREHQEPLLRGRDLIDGLGLTPGPLFSVILMAIEEARLSGEIATRDEALDLARRMADGGGHKAT